MARIRTIKPEFPQSESMGRVSRDARLLFVLLWTIADDFGRTRAASRMLASLLFPYDDDAVQLIPQWLMELEREKCIRVYAIDGNTYVQIEKWSEHQRIDHPSKSKFPSPPEKLARLREGSRKSRLGPRTKDQGPGPEEGSAPPTPEIQFDEFWKEFPVEPVMSKPVAEREWSTLSHEQQAQAIAACKPFKAFRSKDKTYPILHAVTFLAERRFEGFANVLTVDPEKAAAQKDEVDRRFGRGKYASSLQ